MVTRQSRSNDNTTDTQRIAELQSRVEALASLPDLIKPYTAHGTTLRIPAAIGNKLLELMQELRPLLDGAHYADVRYDYQDEPVDGLDAAGIRLQARRVCGAYRELAKRSVAENDISLGAMSELIAEIKRLENWLDPANEPAPRVENSESWETLDKAIARLMMMADLVSAIDSNSSLMDDTLEDLGMTLLDYAIEARTAFDHLNGGGE